MTYALALDDDERRRYRMMAEVTHAEESGHLLAAGLRPGASVADIGCGPGATLRLLAREVGPLGRADGVDQDPDAVAAAVGEVGDLPQASVRRADAGATGLPADCYDLVMCRHVLAHNGGREAGIVAHLARLARPGGTVYLADVDATAIWVQPYEPELADLDERYRAYHRTLGNDLAVGRSLAALLEAAGLAVELFRCGGAAIRIPIGMRGPAWAARDALRRAGMATDADLARWDAAFDRLDTRTDRPWASRPVCIAVGRRPSRDLRGAR